MDIGYYIADLLAVQGEVNLPGVGTFHRQKISGRFDRDTNSLVPPSYGVGFQATEVAGDMSALAHLISLKKNLSKTSSEYFIRKFAGSVLESLEANGIAPIYPLGSLRKQDQSTVLDIDPSYRLGGTYFGLKPISSPVEFDLASNNAQTQPITPEPQPADVGTADPEIIATDPMVSDIQPREEPAATEQPGTQFVQQDSSEIFGTPILEREADDEPVEKQVFDERPRLNVAAIIVGSLAAILMTVGLLTYFFFPDAKNLLFNTTQTAPVDVAPVDTTAPATVPAISDSLAQDSLATTQDTVDSNLVVEATPVVTYEIIGASLARKSDAEAYIKALGQKGRKAKIVENVPGRLIKVSIGTFTDEQSAQSELNRLRDAGQDVWIQRVTQNNK